MAVLEETPKQPSERVFKILEDWIFLRLTKKRVNQANLDPSVAEELEPAEEIRFFCSLFPRRARPRSIGIENRIGLLL